LLIYRSIERDRVKSRDRDRDTDRHREHERERHRRSYSRSRSRERERVIKPKIKHTERPIVTGLFYKVDVKLCLNKNAELLYLLYYLITEADLQGKTPEEQQMMRIMGFCGFDTTKGKKVEGNDAGAVHVILKRKYRQYMNRKGGFNRPLDFVA
jgi:U4/U6.U5 tri-snRNP-associated protein 3